MKKICSYFFFKLRNNKKFPYYLSSKKGEEVLEDVEGEEGDAEEEGK